MVEVIPTQLKESTAEGDFFDYQYIKRVGLGASLRWVQNPNCSKARKTLILQAFLFLAVFKVS